MTYKEKQDIDGREFQDLVAQTMLEQLGIPLQIYTSQAYQFKNGESRQGFEIKFDKKLSQTGNLYIETMETDNTGLVWIPSGVYRDDNSWAYIQGNFDVLYIFDKKMLKRYCEVNQAKWLTCNKGTSRGLLLPQDRASRMAMVILTPKK
jgi:hypothetical protein